MDFQTMNLQFAALRKFLFAMFAVVWFLISMHLEIIKFIFFNHVFNNVRLLFEYGLSNYTF
jgi:hypothetical protein